MSNSSQACASEVKVCFAFLIRDFGYVLSQEKQTRHASILVYVGHGQTIELDYEHMDRRFAFAVIRIPTGSTVMEGDKQFVRTFFEILQPKLPDLNEEMLQPANQSCREAATRNATLMREFAEGVLLGQAW